MARRHNFSLGEYYHCYNRGVEKRKIFLDREDFNYFLLLLELLNDSKSRGVLKLYRSNTEPATPITSVLAYCLNPNHFHLLLYESQEGGISKFMQKVGTGYTMYFNEKYRRSGSLFQGTYKSKHITTDQQLQYLSAYINLNNRVHGITDDSDFRSSMEFYDRGIPSSICSDISIIKEAHRNYKDFAEIALQKTIEERNAIQTPKKTYFLE